VYPDPQQPSRVVGFEVELMKLIAEKLGVRSEFVQGNWDKLPDLLHLDKFDIIVNGYESTKPRLDKMLATRRYYVYELQLMARKDDASIQSWADIRNSPSPKCISVLQGAAAENYVKKQLKELTTCHSFDSATDAMLDVQNKNADATLQDVPIALFYHNRFP